MLDVARLVRSGELDRAGDIHRAAENLARNRSARFVAEWLVDHPGLQPDPRLLDADTGGALTRLGLLTESARARFAEHLGAERFAGRVVDVSGRAALVVDADGNSLPIPAGSSERRLTAGALVAVDTERLDADSATIWVRPAFDTDVDPHARLAGDVQLLTREEQLAAREPASTRQ